MTRIGKYLSVEIQPRPANRKTDTWQVFATAGSELGCVKWFGRWRQYTFDPSGRTTFNSGCLQDLAAFLEQVNERHREGLKPREEERP